MICKNCGFEYVDGLKECPNCQTPNEPQEPQVLTQEERDTFAGLTIETTPPGSEQGEYKVYEGSEEEAGNTGQRPFGFRVRTFGGVSLLWQILIVLAIVAIIFIVLPMLAVFTLLAAVCYYLYIWFLT